MISLADHIGTFKPVMELSTGEEMNMLCQRHAGVYRFAELLEMLAKGIADSSIPVSE